MAQFSMGGGWGNHISWLEPEQKVYGHKRRLPRKGDEILSRMKSGKTGVYRITSIRYARDPADMFFADVRFVGCVGEELEPAAVPVVKTSLQADYAAPTPRWPIVVGAAGVVLLLAALFGLNVWLMW